jgi:hypothetical protein
MSSEYLRSLEFQRASIERAIEIERSTLQPDWMRLARLKKQRLAVKDRIARLSVRAPRARSTPLSLRRWMQSDTAQQGGAPCRS